MSKEPEYIDLTKITDDQLKQLHENFLNCGRSLSKPISGFITGEIEKLNHTDLNDLLIIQNVIQEIKNILHPLDHMYSAILKIAVFKKLDDTDKNEEFYN